MMAIYVFQAVFYSVSLIRSCSVRFLQISEFPMNLHVKIANKVTVKKANHFRFSSKGRCVIAAVHGLSKHYIYSRKGAVLSSTHLVPSLSSRLYYY